MSLHTVQEVRDMLRLKSDEAVLALIHSGRLQAKNIGGPNRPTWRIKSEWVEAFLNDDERKEQRKKKPTAKKRAGFINYSELMFQNRN